MVFPCGWWERGAGCDEPEHRNEVVAKAGAEWTYQMLN